jgi:hypothetical protein
MWMITNEHGVENGIVYFIRDVSSGLIKIGWSAQFKSRAKSLLKQIEILTPHGIYKPEVEILLILKGSQNKEFSLHQRFRNSRVQKDREWFFPSNQLFDFIDSNRLHCKMDPVVRYDKRGSVLDVDEFIEGVFADYCAFSASRIAETINASWRSKIVGAVID